MRRREILLIALATATAALAGSALYSRHQTHRRGLEYRTRLTEFRRAIPVGSNRKTVEAYLDSHNFDFATVRHGGSPNSVIQVQIGEVPDKYGCSRWEIYVEFEFADDDTLRDTHIAEAGVCL